jgi:hypothetical protein
MGPAGFHLPAIINFVFTGYLRIFTIKIRFHYLPQTGPDFSRKRCSPGTQHQGNTTQSIAKSE